LELADSSTASYDWQESMLEKANLLTHTLFKGRVMKNTALLLIDVQKGLNESHFGGARNNPDAVNTISKLLTHWRAQQRPVIHIQHCSTEPQSPLRESEPGNDFMDEAMPIADEPVFKKSVNSAFIGTNLEAHLKQAGIKSLVIVGLTTEHCVSTSTRMAGNLGFDVMLVSDATAANPHKGIDGNMIDAQTIHDVNLASLNGEFCQVVMGSDLLN